MSQPAEPLDYSQEGYACQTSLYTNDCEWYRCGYPRHLCSTCADLGFDNESAYEINYVIGGIRKKYHLPTADNRVFYDFQQEVGGIYQRHGKKDHVWAYVTQAAPEIAPGWQLCLVEGQARLVNVDPGLDGTAAASPIDPKGGTERVDEEDPLQKDSSMNNSPLSSKAPLSQPSAAKSALASFLCRPGSTASIQNSAMKDRSKASFGFSDILKALGISRNDGDSHVDKLSCKKSLDSDSKSDTGLVHTSDSLDMAAGSKKNGKAPSEGSVSTKQGDEKSEKYRGSRRSSLNSDSGSASFSEK